MAEPVGRVQARHRRRRRTRWLLLVAVAAAGVAVGLAAGTWWMVQPATATPAVSVPAVHTMTQWDDNPARGALRCEGWQLSYGRGGAVCDVRPISQAPDREQALAGVRNWEAYVARLRGAG